MTFDAVDSIASDYGKRVYPLNTWDYQAQIQNQNDTKITIAYLSEPYAISKNQIMFNKYDVSSNRHEYDGVYEWGFDDSVTISDADSMYYEDYDGNGGYFSIAVGYYVGGLLFEDQDTKMLSVPTVMNNGVVYLRAAKRAARRLTRTLQASPCRRKATSLTSSILPLTIGANVRTTGAR